MNTTTISEFTNAIATGQINLAEVIQFIINYSIAVGNVIALWNLVRISIYIRKGK
jgi:hypothetical protein